MRLVLPGMYSTYGCCGEDAVTEMNSEMELMTMRPTTSIISSNISDKECQKSGIRTIALLLELDLSSNYSAVSGSWLNKLYIS